MHHIPTSSLKNRVSNLKMLGDISYSEFFVSGFRAIVRRSKKVFSAKGRDTDKPVDNGHSPPISVSQRCTRFNAAKIPFSRRSLSIPSTIAISLPTTKESSSQGLNRHSWNFPVSSHPHVWSSVAPMRSKLEEHDIADVSESQSQLLSTSTLSESSSFFGDLEDSGLSEILDDYPPPPQFCPSLNLVPHLPSTVDACAASVLSRQSYIYHDSAPYPPGSDSQVKGLILPQQDLCAGRLGLADYATESFVNFHDRYWLTFTPEPFDEDKQDLYDPAHDVDWRQFHTELLDSDL